MSNMESPAGHTGGDSTASGELAGLPPKLRVHALAKLLGASSRDVMATLEQLGETVRSAQSSISRDVAERVAEALLPDEDQVDLDDTTLDAPVAEAEPEPVAAPLAPVFAAPQPLFMAPTQPAPAPARKRAPEPVAAPAEEPEAEDEDQHDEHAGGDADDDEAGNRRRRRRGRRGRGRGRGAAEDGEDEDGLEENEQPAASAEEPVAEDDDEDDEAGGTRRRRRRRRRKAGGEDEPSPRADDPPNTVVHVREVRENRQDAPPGPLSSDDEVRSVKGSTRLEAKRQRRRDGREAGRRRAPILSEAEFLARREAVDRKMVVREREDRIQIAVLEDGVLVEHFVTSSGSGSLVGNVYLGRVQNVLPSMEAAFVDIGKGRNAVLYAGEVDWDAAGLEGKARKIEQALSTGDSVLVQVTKDPVGHKGARLTTQISLPGRFLVYVPGGGATGISRKLPDTERKRLKDILKRIVPEDAGVIIRTASEGISEDALGRDVGRLRAQWEIIKEKADVPKAQAPQLLYEEPDLLIKVIRDLFTEDFSALIVQGAQAGEVIENYVQHVAPDLASRLRKHVGANDVFTEHRITEQITKALDRKVWLPSGGYLVIDRTEAMTVIDVNTGKFTGSGGNLEETVTRNNLEAAEEIVRQLRLRDVGGIIVVDFIDMVLESNRDLVLRRLTECLGRDRTRHQVAEVTSLGLVQMTRKRVGTGLLEAFSATCEHCRGRGLVVSTEPLHSHGGGNGGAKNGNGKSGNGNGNGNGNGAAAGAPSGGSGSGSGAGAGSGKEGRRSRQRNRGGGQDQPAAEVAAETHIETAPVTTPQAETERTAPAKSEAERPEQAKAEPAKKESAKRRESKREAAKAEQPAPAAEQAPEQPAVAAQEPAGAALNGHGGQHEEQREPVTVPATAKRRQPRRAVRRAAGPPVTGIKEG
ncbi:translation initiation factor IF-2 N-terminal domain-containing protein [Crossiella sp. NPDC003009]